MEAIILFGPPGSGKGTQSQLLAKHLNFAHISTGQILREEIAAKTALGQQVEAIISKGHLAPDDLMIKIIEEFIRKHKQSKGIIFDGFPRTLKQAELLNESFKTNSIKKVTIVNLEADSNELIKRLLNRAKLEGRADDTPDTINNRLQVYEKQTFPILSFYMKTLSSEQIKNINALGTIEEIQENIINVL